MASGWRAGDGRQSRTIGPIARWCPWALSLASAWRAACREVVHVAAITHCTLSQDMLWAITCYFNPIGHRRRLSNYRVFRRRLNVPLVTVELGYHDVFELPDGGGMALYVRDRLHDRTREALVDPAHER